MCRYEAAQILKKSGIAVISGFSLGEILHFLHLLKNRSWISFHKSDWIPLTRNLERISSSGMVDNNPTKKGQGKGMTKFISFKEEMMVILRAWIMITVKGNDGYDIFLIRRNFLLETGRRLNLRRLGYESLGALIRNELSDVVTMKQSVRCKSVWLIWPTCCKGN